MTTPVKKSSGPRTLVGYCWPWTARPGEQVDFMVSCHTPGAYRADLVRIVCGDDLSSAAMFKEKELRAPFSGDHPGRFQPTHPGSYVEIAPNAVLDHLASFTVQAMVCPTLLPDGQRVRLGGVSNSIGDTVIDEQHLVSRWDKSTQRGWALLIDREGRPVFMIGTGETVHRAVLGKALVQDRWFIVAGSLDAQNGRLRIAAGALDRCPGDSVAWPNLQHEQDYPRAHEVPKIGPLRFAACADGAGNGSRLKPAQCFNGRLDRVRLSEGVRTFEEAHCLAGMAIAPSLESQVVGFWDFSKDIEHIEITDLSSNALHGVAVNVPTRAVRGVDWDGTTNDWRVRPDHYSAIHFHDDTLYDAEWRADFSYVVPEDLPSGIYAARLRAGAAEDYIPFFVAPERGKARSAVAFLAPTLSYTAYTNITGLNTFKYKRPMTDGSGHSRVIEEDVHSCLLQSAADGNFLLAHHRELGMGIYANHTDGMLTSCASQRHPNMTIKPKGVNWTLVADTYLTDWLEQKSIPYDVITDDLLHEEGIELLQQYAVVITGNHPEYYTRRMLDAVDRYQRDGGRWMYLGGNGFYWVTSLHSQLPGLIEVRKDNTYAGHCPRAEAYHAFERIHGGFWRDNGRAPQLLFGVGLDPYSGNCWERGIPYRRLPDSYEARAAFIFEGVTNETIGDYGIFAGGAAGQEVDAISRERGTPAHALHLARADTFVREGTALTAGYPTNTRPPIADMVFFETPNGGAVFSVGSMSWTGSLSHNGYQNDIARITENVLRRFMDGKPLMHDKSLRK